MTPQRNPSRTGSVVAGIATIAAALLVGCKSTAMPPATRPAVEALAVNDDPRLADADFWWSRPALASARGNPEALWSAAERAAKDLLFEIDRRDWRAGLLTTRPMISAQWFEPWRRDAATPAARTESTLATVRRTIRFEFVSLDDGSQEVRPRVLVERQAVLERQVTSSAMVGRAFARRSLRGSMESDRGIYLPDRYWYALGRDTVLERQLAGRIDELVARR